MKRFLPLQRLRRMRTGSREDVSSEPEVSHARAPRRIALEPLEDRVLLSADPLLLALAVDALHADDAIVRVLDSTPTDAATDAASHRDAPVETRAQEPTLLWPEGLRAQGDDSLEWTPLEDAAPPASDPAAERQVSDPQADSDAGEVAAEVAASVVSLVPVSPQSGSDSGATTPTLGSGTSPDVARARGPPHMEPVSLHAFDALRLDAQSGSPLSAGLRTDAGAAPALAALEQDDLSRVLDVAIATFARIGLDAGSLERLADVSIEIVDLPGTLLARSDATGIEIDVSAAGLGWFVDPTPAEHAEFVFAGDSGVAPSGSAAAGRVDLLTALLHQLAGWVADEAPAARALRTLGDTLAPGVRVRLAVAASASGPAELLRAHAALAWRSDRLGTPSPTAVATWSHFVPTTVVIASPTGTRTPIATAPIPVVLSTAPILSDASLAVTRPAGATLLMAPEPAPVLDLTPDEAAPRDAGARGGEVASAIPGSGEEGTDPDPDGGSSGWLGALALAAPLASLSGRSGVSRAATAELRQGDTSDDGASPEPDVRPAPTAAVLVGTRTGSAVRSGETADAEAGGLPGVAPESVSPEGQIPDDSLARGPPAESDLLVSATGVGPGGVLALSDLELQGLLEAALQVWIDAGYLPSDSTLLSSLTFQIGDLSGAALGDASGSTITIDATAADHGWFVDTTPEDDVEFGSSPPAGMDLLTVLAHEIGHAFGLVHTGPVGALMNGALAPGERLHPATTLNEVIDALLESEFDPNFDPTPPGQTFDVTHPAVPTSVTIGTNPSGGADLELQNVTLVFAELSYDFGNARWDGEVGVVAPFALLFPGLLDIGIVDDGLDAPRPVIGASDVTPVLGKFQVAFMLAGDHRDIEVGDEIAVLNSNRPGFDDADLADDSQQVVVVEVAYDDVANVTTLWVDYNLDPSGDGAWNGGSLIALADVDIDDDADLLAVGGTLHLDPGNPSSILRFDKLEAADIGWPRWLRIRIEQLQMEFVDFRGDESASTLKLDASFLGFDTGFPLLNVAIDTILTVNGTASGVEFDLDLLGQSTRVLGIVQIPKNPIVSLDGISGEIKGNIFVASLQAGFILKKVSVDANGLVTTQDSEVVASAIYGAVRGAISFGGRDVPDPDKPGETKKEGAYSFGFNFAISELGPLSVFVFSNVKILLDPVSQLTIFELRGGVRFNTTLEDLQVRPPFTATGGRAEATGDLLLPTKITLTLPGHNLRVGDEFRVQLAGDDDLLGEFVVSEVDGDDISYLVEGPPGDYSIVTPIEVRKLTISDPIDLRDPGFQSSKSLTLAQWETQLDQQVANQLTAGDSFWDVLFDNVVFELGATMGFATIPSFVLSFDVDLLLDTQLRMLLTGTMNVLTVLKVPVKLFADLSDVGQGELTFLLLGDLPAIPTNTAGILPLLVLRAGVKFELLVNGQPASLEGTTGLPVGVGFDVTGASVLDVAAPGEGPGPWQVTFSLDLPTGVVASDEFAIGDQIVVVNSDPDTFDGGFRVTAVDDALGTVTFLVGARVLGSGVDVNLDGLIDAMDDGMIGQLPVIDGRIDRNRDGKVDEDDDGEVFTVVTGPGGEREVVGYALVDGWVDVDGDGVVNGDPDDVGVIGEDPGVWLGDSRVANEADLGDGFRISIEGGIDFNIPFVTTLTFGGSAMLDVTFPGPGADEDVRFDFDIDMSLSESSVGTIGLVAGKLHLTADTDILDSQGGISFPTVKLWGAALLQTDFTFLEALGIFANAEGVLRINTTDQEQPAELLPDGAGGFIEVALPKESVAVRLDGSLGFRIDWNDDDVFQADEQVFLIEGSFVFEFSADQGFNVAVFRDVGGVVGPATLSIGPAADPFLQFDVFGFMAVRPFGFAANMILSIDAALPGALASVANVQGQFVFMVNTTFMDISFSIPGQADSRNGGSDLTVLIPRAPPQSITDVSLNVFDLIAGNAWDLPAIQDGGPLGGAYVLIHLGGTDPTSDPDASLTIGPFELRGKFSFLIGATVNLDLSVDLLLEITAEYSLRIVVGPLTLLDLEGDGFLRFDNSGLVASLSLDLAAGVPGSFGFSLNVDFELQLNSTAAPFQGIPAHTFRLHMEGSLSVLGALTLEGTFDLSIDASGVHLAMTGHFDLLGVRADFVAEAAITSAGFSFDASLTLATGGALSVVPGLFNVGGSFRLFLSTITGDAFISIQNANVNLMGLVMSGDLTIGVRSGEFFVYVPSSNPLTLSFFGIATLKVSGSYNYNATTDTVGGHGFRFTASATLLIGIEGFLGVKGTISITFDSAASSFSAHVSGTAWIVGISFGAAADLRVSGTAISLRLSVTVTLVPSFRIWIPFKGTVTVPAVRATYSHTFNIGSTTPPTQFDIPAPDPPVLARLVGSDLYLNLGVDDGLRDPNGDWDDDDPSESFRVTHVSGVQGNETVSVDAYGFQQEFSGVARIVVADAEGGEDVIEIAAGVLADAELHGGDDNDRLVYLGSGRALLFGDDGDDFLMSGSGGSSALPNQLAGGDGSDRIQGGSGVSDVFGGDGNDFLIWDLGSGAQLATIDGGSDLLDDQRDTLIITGTDGDDQLVVNAETGGGFSVSSGVGSAAAQLVESLIVDAHGGADQITVNDLAASSLVQVTVRLGQNADESDDDGAQDVVSVRGGSGAEAYTVTEFEGTVVSVDVDDVFNVAIEQGDAANGDRAVGDLLRILGNGGADTVDATALGTFLVNLIVELGDEADSILGSDFDDLIEILIEANTLGTIQIDGRSGNDTYVVQLLGGDTEASIEIADSGVGGFDAVIVNGTPGAEHITLTALTFTQGSNSETLTYSGLESFSIVTLGGEDLVTIESTHLGLVHVDSGDDDDVIAIQSVSGDTTIDTGSGNDRVNVGSNASVLANGGGTLNEIAASLAIDMEGDAGDVLDLDDSADGLPNVGATLSSLLLTGLGTASGIGYAGVEELRIGLGSGADELVVLSTHGEATRIDGGGGGDALAVRSVAGATTILTGAGSDVVHVGSNASIAANVGGTLDDIAALLDLDLGGDAGDLLDLDDTGDTTSNLDGQLTSLLLTGLGTASGIAYAGVADLRIHLGSAADAFLVLATHAGATRIDGNGGADTISLRTLSGPTTVHTQDGSDRVNVGSNASSGSNTGGLLDDVDGLLTVDLGTGVSDVLDVDDSGDVLANTDGQLTGSLLTGLGMANGIAYAEVEDLRIHLGSGADAFLVLATHVGTTHVDGNGGADTISLRTLSGPTTVHTQDGSDRVNVGSNASSGSNTGGLLDDVDGLLTVDLGTGVSDVLDVDDSGDTTSNLDGQLTGAMLTGLGMASGIAYAEVEDLRIHLGSGDDVFLVLATHAGATLLETNAGADRIDVRSLSGETSLFTGDQADSVNVGSTSPASGGLLDGIGDGPGDWLRVDGGSQSSDDVLVVDDSGDTLPNLGILSATTLTGLGMSEGIEYHDIEVLSVSLGSGPDGFFIESTHVGATQLWAGSGEDSVGAQDDVVSIASIAGETTVHGEGGNDVVLVNVSRDPARDANGLDDDGDGDVDEPGESYQAPLRTHQNGIAAPLHLHGESGSDLVMANLAGEGDAVIDVFDGGAPDDGVDTLVVNGADDPAAAAGENDDVFLLRREFVALLNDTDGDGVVVAVERVNYDENVNARLIVNGLAGEDAFFIDDNSSITTVDGGDDADYFQVGQVFGLPRTVDAGIAPGDVFATTPVVIGVVRDAGGALVFDPSHDVLDQAARDAIDAAIAEAQAGGLVVEGIAYLSNGVSQPTTLFGGDGPDVFSVYHNKGPLRLEGESGNDEFIVRAFVVLSGLAQGQTEVNGGEGEDLIQYAVNAPVSIDGGSGFDTVVVLGTPFADAFVVTADGIFGAGLSVLYANVESAELDTLEGDDDVFVLGTNEELVTLVVGGLGNDHIRVLGDVTETIRSSNPLGRSGFISHRVVPGGDVLFDAAAIEGVSVTVSAADESQLVDISQQALRVSEDGLLLAAYEVQLNAPLADGFATVYLTVSAGVASSADRALGGRSLLVGRDEAGPFSEALVLSFDAANAPQMVWVKADPDLAAEGERVALISHAINSASEAYDDLALPDVFVTIVDDDQPGLDVRQIDIASLDPSDVTGGVVDLSGVDLDELTRVLEGDFSDAWAVALTRAPDANEIVRVTLVQPGGELELTTTSLEFDASNWNQFRLVGVSASQEAPGAGVAEGTSVTPITHEITSALVGPGTAVYGGLGPDDFPQLDVVVFDDDVAGVIVTPSDGSTRVVEGGAGDDYTLQLTREPTAPVTLRLTSDGQTRLLSADPRFSVIEEDAASNSYLYQVVMGPSDWNDPIEIVVEANPDFVPTAGSVLVFAPADQDLSALGGPLIVQGGPGTGKDRSLADAVGLPGEDTRGSGAEQLPGEEQESVDTLTVFNTDSSDAVEIGALIDRSGQDIGNPGLALVGLGTSDDLVIDQGAPGAPDLVTFGGGITYGDFELVEILLGRGSDHFTIDATADGATTVVHGGAGSDEIVANERGAGPLVIYGDTSADGVRYGNDTGEASENGSFFPASENGNDLIDASALAEQGDGYTGVVVFGGPGDDEIHGSQDDDHLAGGAGDDWIAAGAGNDHVYGDSAFDVDLASRFLQAEASLIVVTDRTPGMDTLYGDAGDDVIFGDHGRVQVSADTLRLTTTTDGIERIETTSEDRGEADEIHGGPGDDRLFGGLGADRIWGDAGNDLIFGDHGVLDYASGDADLATLDLATTRNRIDGDADEVRGGSGDDVIFGGPGGDLLFGGNGPGGPAIPAGTSDRDVILGDFGRIEYVDGLAVRIETTDTDLGGDDTLGGDEDADLLFGGFGADALSGDAGDDILLGDNGRVDLVAGVIASLQTTDGDASTGGDDVLSGGPDDDILLGGVGGDELRGDAGDDLVLGDQALLRWDLDADLSTLDQVLTRQIDLGGLDQIFGGEDADWLIGGVTGDEISGEGGDDLIFGDFAELLLSDGELVLARSIDRDQGGSDLLFGNDGDDVLVGGAADDVIDGGAGKDLVAGDNALLDRTQSAGDFSDPRFHTLLAGLLYDASGNAAVDLSTSFPDPGGAPAWADWRLTLLDHSFAVEAAGGNDFGDDYLAGGPDDDLLFGQLGDDVIQGDGSVEGALQGAPVSATPLPDHSLLVVPSFEAATDGDDHIEGGGGRDVIFGNLGQDDIIGGSSSAFGLTTRDQRPDDADVLFGGSGERWDRNQELLPGNAGDVVLLERHARDSDAIVGDNGDIHRIVNADGTPAEFRYDQSGPYEDRGSLRIAVRAIQWLDYTPGGLDYDPTAVDDLGAGDWILGESGDDFLYGGIGHDRIFGDSEDDDIVAGVGADFVSGGTGSDGILGDDGRIATSRNTALDGNEPMAEPLWGISKLAQVSQTIGTPGGLQQALIHPEGALLKTADLEPFQLGPDPEQAPVATPSNDILFGGLGDDFVHGGVGDDAISGAEALPGFYAHPWNPGDVLGFGQRSGGFEFLAYDEYNPLRKVLVDANGAFTTDASGTPFILNFAAGEGPLTIDAGFPAVASDGDDHLFGDLGNDWLVGGTGNDRVFGGRGDDLINLDDDHDSTLDPNDPLSLASLANDVPDTHPSYEDIGYGGAGRDVLIANTGGDRLIDWAGEFNSYLVPFAPFGAFTISRSLQPQLMDYLYGLSRASGADPTRDSGIGDPRNGEPYGELGLVNQKDLDWQLQTGAPDDPQPGNIPGGPRDVLRGASFDGVGGAPTGFLADSGSWAVQNGVLKVQPEYLGGDAVSVLHLSDPLPTYFEVTATINAAKDRFGWESNAYLIFDYQGPDDFKFAGVDAKTNKIQVGQRVGDQWIVEVQAPAQIRGDTNYNVRVAVNGTSVVLVVDNQHVLMHTFDARVVDGVSYGLNAGWVGVGSINSIGFFDNVTVQVLPPEAFYEATESFDAAVAAWLQAGVVGDAALLGGSLIGTPELASGTFLATLGLDVSPNHLLEAETKLVTQTLGGLVFDYVAPDRFKFAALAPALDLVVIGHVTDRGWVVDASVARDLDPAAEQRLEISLKNSTVAVLVDGQVVLSHAFNAMVGDGDLGLLGRDGQVSFGELTLRSSDPAFHGPRIAGDLNGDGAVDAADAALLLADLASLEVQNALCDLNGDGQVDIDDWNLLLARMGAQAPADEIDEEAPMAMVAAAPAPEASGAPALDRGSLERLARDAVSRWSASLDDALLQLALSRVRFEVADLEGPVLGSYRDGVVRIDLDAAGNGWFVDPTPGDDGEFEGLGSALVAVAGSPATQRMDLLSVVLHELGHALGERHEPLAASLGVGERLLPDALAGPDAPPARDPAPQHATELARASWLEALRRSSRHGPACPFLFEGWRTPGLAERAHLEPPWKRG